MYIVDDYEKSFISMEELIKEVNLEDFTVNSCLNFIADSYLPKKID